MRLWGIYHRFNIQYYIYIYTHYILLSNNIGYIYIISNNYTIGKPYHGCNSIYIQYSISAYPNPISNLWYWTNIWLVVLTILKIWVRQWEGWQPIYEMENKIHVPNHQPGIQYDRVFLGFPCFFFPPSGGPNSWSKELIEPPGLEHERLRDRNCL